jgi:predicted permease
MVVAEVALSCVLLVLAGLTIHSIVKIESASLGFDPHGVMSARVALPETEYKEGEKQQQFFQQLLTRLRARPEIASVGVANSPPTWGGRNPVIIEGREVDTTSKTGSTWAAITSISPGYLTAMSVRLLQGRDFTDADVMSAPAVAIVSSDFAAQYWPGESAIGKRFRRGKPGEKDPTPWLTVVGIVPATLKGQFESKTWPQAYVCYLQEKDSQRMTLFAKARGGDPALLTPVLRAAVREQNDDLPIYFVQTLAKMVEEAKFFKKLFGWIFGVFGGVALILAGVGLYGVMAYSVAQRTQEIGVRVALGAGPGDVLRLILREGGMRLLIGLAIGSVIGFFGTKLLASSLYGVGAGDPITFGGTLVTLGLIGFFATLVPALRALRVNPVVALRNE